MFCRNCGRPIPDDAKFCPYCGASSDLTKSETTTSMGPIGTIAGIKGENNQQPNVVTLGSNKPIDKDQILKTKLDKLGPKKIKDLYHFSIVFQISTILAFVGVLIFFAGSPITSVIDSESSSGAQTFQAIYQWFMIVYALILLGLTITNIVLLAIKRKELDLKGIKPAIITKSVCGVLLLAFIVLMSIKTIGHYDDKAAIFIPCMILTGLCFVTCGLNGSMSQPFAVLKTKTYKKLYPNGL